MTSFHSASLSITWLATIGLCVPALPAAAAGPPPVVVANCSHDNPRPIRDVALQGDGLLTGQVLDPQFRPVPNAEVAILAGDDVVAITHTDSNGLFAVTGLRGGVHQVCTPVDNEVCRLWAAGTAPPSAVDSLRISPVETTVRGQGGQHYAHEPFPHAKAIATHPLTVGGLLAAAVAIPVALNNSDRPPGS